MKKEYLALKCSYIQKEREREKENWIERSHVNNDKWIENIEKL